MLLKFKNKYLLAIHKLIKEAESVGGIIDSIILEPKEAMGLLLELVNLGKEYTTDIIVLNAIGEDVTREKLLWVGLRLDKAERIKELVNSWYKMQYQITYKDIPLRIVKPKPKEKTNKWHESTVPNPLDKTDMGVATITNSEKEQEEFLAPEEILKSWKTHDIPPITKQMVDSGVTTKQLQVPSPPKGPPNRIIRDDLSDISGSRVCKECGSSLQTKWIFFKGNGCIQPECDNYWDKKK